MVVKFSDMQFEKSDLMRVMGMTRKRALVKGSRHDYCATPSFAREVSLRAVKNLVDAIEEADHATMRSKILKTTAMSHAILLYFLLICQRM